MADTKVISLTAEHWPEVRRIYEEGLKTGNASFETTVPEWGEWDNTHRKKCRFVSKTGDSISGWAALTDYSPREVYSGVAEVSIYVDTDFQGQGVGDTLLKHLIYASEDNQTWTLQATVFPENKASIRLHQKHGFRIVGKRSKIAKLNQVWRDVVILERRSEVTGTR